ncbi:3-methyl-2-oxobutanoate hydroxymethyltransferase [Streptomyces sp. NPDC055287]
MKERGEKWAMLTAYDVYIAATFDEAGIPVLLTGDSASNNVFGDTTSLPVTVDELLPLVHTVSEAARRALVIADLPCGGRRQCRGPVAVATSAAISWSAPVPRFGCDCRGRRR